MKFFGTMSAVLTALYLAGLTTLPLLVCLVPIGIEIAINSFYLHQARRKENELWAKITELGEAVEKETKDNNE